MEAKVKALSELIPGERGVITEVNHPEKVTKLMEMGCLPGEELRLDHIAPMGDPIAITLTGYKLSLRKRDAKHIMVRLIQELQEKA